jgi:hypothetical protein
MSELGLAVGVVSRVVRLFAAVWRHARSWLQVLRARICCWLVVILLLAALAFGGKSRKQRGNLPPATPPIKGPLGAFITCVEVML